jgi:hypothetical protein
LNLLILSSCLSAEWMQMEGKLQSSSRRDSSTALFTLDTKITTCSREGRRECSMEFGVEGKGYGLEGEG